MDSDSVKRISGLQLPPPQKRPDRAPRRAQPVVTVRMEEELYLRVKASAWRCKISMNQWLCHAADMLEKAEQKLPAASPPVGGSSQQHAEVDSHE